MVESTKRRVLKRRVNVDKHGKENQLVYINFQSEIPFQRISNDIHPDDTVLFLKDNNNSYRSHVETHTSVVDMLNSITNSDPDSFGTGTTGHIPPFVRTTNTHGVACKSNTKKALRGLAPKQYKVTDWAHRSVLWTFLLGNYSRKNQRQRQEDGTLKRTKLSEEFVSEYRPMGAWVNYLSTRTRVLRIDNKEKKEEQQKELVKEAVQVQLQGRRRLNAAKPDNTNDNNNNNKRYSRTRKHYPVFSNAYMNHVVSRTMAQDGYYYNFTHEGLDYPVDKPEQLKNSPRKSATKTYKEVDVVPTCFGGVFATQWGQLASQDAAVTPHGWAVITNELSRADNIEEGHYMERWWADLLSWSSYSSTRKKQRRLQLQLQLQLQQQTQTQTDNEEEEESQALASSLSSLEELFKAAMTSSSSPSDSTVDDLDLGILTSEQQRDMLKHKMLHFSSPDSYTGLIVLDKKTYTLRELRGINTPRQVAMREKEKAKKRLEGKMTSGR